MKLPRDYKKLKLYQYYICKWDDIFSIEVYIGGRDFITIYSSDIFRISLGEIGNLETDEGTITEISYNEVADKIMVENL